jgi:hypothetical protein
VCFARSVVGRISNPSGCVTDGLEIRPAWLRPQAALGKCCRFFPMARWPRHLWTSIFTYGTIFVLFPILCLLAYAWVRGMIF